jgi:hypothetical protein
MVLSFILLTSSDRMLKTSGKEVIIKAKDLKKDTEIELKVTIVSSQLEENLTQTV